MQYYYGSSYRYFNIVGAKITLNDLTLRFTRYDGLNDPLDGSSLIINNTLSEIAKKEVITLIQANAIVLHPNSIKKQREYISKERALNSKNRPKGKSEIQFVPFNEQYYTCCFSKHYITPDSFLLWSYYADKHHGVCIEFNFDEFILIPLEVYYTPKIEKLSTELNFREQIPSSEIKKYLIQKQICWKHENEVRLIGREEFFNEKGIIYSLNSDKLYLNIVLEKKHIRKVVFGCLTLQKDIDEIIQLLNNLDVEKNINIEKMYIDEDTLEFKAKPYARL